MTIQYLVNRNNEKLYKAVDNKKLFMWYESLKDWGECCTLYSDLFNGDYLDNFEFVDEDKLWKYK